MSKDMQFRLIGDSKMPLSVDVNVSGCLSLYVSPVIDWQPVQVVTRLSPNVSSEPIQPPTIHDKRYRQLIKSLILFLRKVKISAHFQNLNSFLRIMVLFFIPPSEALLRFLKLFYHNSTSDLIISV